ncbi:MULTISPECIES: DUF4198 domain-containing protein [Methylomicrobium]|uniref:ABC-type Co2+ transport system, periplasmic component n=1 Tax=Methylomicrobium album BG8 TaxID=686340 RepID=H8GKL2_METAL|nr:MULTISPECIES: DUF4198 domain-containing protein [Methylomicrobium]EIC28020.1 ABC-type Co2+ transport system, periplasmic component [Methylomicrobium album BG8]
MRSFANLSLLIGSIFVSPKLAAHEYWLAPSAYSAPVGQTLAVQAYVGSDFKGELRPFAATRTVRLEVQTKERKDVKSRAINGDLDLAHLTVEDEGGIVVAFETHFVPVELPPEKFDEYLRREGLEGPLKAREALGAAAGPGRERYLRCAKAWIAGSDDSRLRKPFGMPLEIIPRSDPLVSGKLTVQVLYNAQPLEGIRVKAWNQALASGAVPRDQMARGPVQPVAQTRTDKNGVAILEIEGPGEWLLSAVHMQPSADKQAADWESRWASLTFARVPK